MQEVEPFSTYSLGYFARRQGMKKEENPFPKTGEWHGNWLRGWEHCDEEISKKKPVIIPLKLVK